MKITKENVKDFLGKHKKAVIIGLGSIAGVIAVVVLSGKNDTQIENEDFEDFEEFDPGKLINMQFVDPDTKEIIGEAQVYESYAKDMLDIISDEENTSEVKEDKET